MLKKAIISSIVGIVTIALMILIIKGNAHASERITTTFDYYNIKTELEISNKDIYVHAEGENVLTDDLKEEKELSVFFKNDETPVQALLASYSSGGNEKKGAFGYLFFYDIDSNEDPVTADISQIDYIIFDGVKVDVQ